MRKIKIKAKNKFFLEFVVTDKIHEHWKYTDRSEVSYDSIEQVKEAIEILKKKAKTLLKNAPAEGLNIVNRVRGNRIPKRSDDLDYQED